eukprot:CAMPEP_0114555550 /NCGR_PEP_ID=MMETSP0114-20121206/8811_1 /TAXON_ID=31324 /ORGANISM="Goniomonas sp, Strain m" /LENGTH=242 /DNA_ID=CAMNT_0001740687 /DNA_START=18 /DNA_END=746 /DNA_ORIENTATION=+
MDTRDHEDHTFCGIMFDVECRDSLPMEYIEISSVWIRGYLGPIKVFATPCSFKDKHESPECWTKLYEGDHRPSPQTLKKIDLQVPVRLYPGTSIGLYVHSARPGDEAIVYDNQRLRRPVSGDMNLAILPGLAHLSSTPFSHHALWGAWRHRREFVGRLSYGVRWLMWNPEVHDLFPQSLQTVVMAVLMGAKRKESILYLLHDEMVLYILNSINWWESFKDVPEESADEDDDDEDDRSHSMWW